jgi:recombination protein RecA
MGEALNAVIKSLNKDFKNNLIITGEEYEDCDKLKLTSPRLNYMLHGGIPIGRLIELYGDENGGKSLIALDAVANFQNSGDGRQALWVDAEQTFDKAWAIKNGVDVDDLLLYKPDEKQGAETIFETILTIAKTGEVGMIVIDSIGVLSSEKELDDKTTLADKQYGGIAIPLTKFAKQMIPLASQHKCTVIGINQERELINSPYGGKRTVGGKGWKFDVSLRLAVKKGKYFNDKYADVTSSEESPVGHKVEVAMTKSKNGPSDRRNGFFTLRYDIGIDYLYDVVDFAMNKAEIIVKAGAWYSFPNGDKVQGIDKVIKYLEEHEDTLKEIEEKIDEFIA